MKTKRKDWSAHPYLVSDARKRWRYSPARNEALKKGKVDIGTWKCTQCAAVVGNVKYLTKRGRKASKVDGAVDHIIPVGKQPRTWDEYPDYYRRMFCDASNLTFLCTACHDTKTAQERQIRTAERKALKGQK